MRLVVHHLVEDALRELADEQYQRQLWMSSEGPEVSSFTECVSRLFDDSGLATALDAPGGVYDREIDDQLRELSQILLRIDASRPPEAILEDPRLVRARAMASRALEQLRCFGYDDYP